MAAWVLLFAVPAAAQSPAADEPIGVEQIDRVAVRWHARATGGVASPQFITARELAFEARIEAISEGYGKTGQPFNEKHVRAALQRHITEAILARLPVEPTPTPTQVGTYAEAARVLIEERVGGRQVLNDAASAEGLEAAELNAYLRRRARAGWYLDKTIAPMLKPTELDLRAALQAGESDFTGKRFEDVEELLRNWYISTRLATALDQYFRTIRSRVSVSVIDYELW